MSGTWMLAVDLRARLPGLLDDQVRRVLLDHDFNAGFLVTGNYDEMRDVRRDSVVFRWSELDLLDAGVIRALAVEWEGLLDTVLFSAFIDAIVDRTKDLFVVRRAVGELHRTILARLDGITRPPSVVYCSEWPKASSATT